MKRVCAVLIFLFFAFLIPGCATPGDKAPTGAQVEQPVVPSAQPTVKPEKVEPAQTALSDAEIERLKSIYPEIEETDLPAAVRVKTLAESARASYEKYFTQKIKTGSGDKGALSDALTSYTEADKLIRPLIVKYPHSEFLWTTSCSVGEDLRLLQTEQK